MKLIADNSHWVSNLRSVFIDFVIPKFSSGFAIVQTNVDDCDGLLRSCECPAADLANFRSSVCFFRPTPWEIFRFRKRWQICVKTIWKYVSKLFENMCQNYLTLVRIMQESLSTFKTFCKNCMRVKCSCQYFDDLYLWAHMLESKLSFRIKYLMVQFHRESLVKFKRITDFCSTNKGPHFETKSYQYTASQEMCWSHRSALFTYLKTISSPCWLLGHCWNLTVPLFSPVFVTIADHLWPLLTIIGRFHRWWILVAI